MNLYQDGKDFMKLALNEAKKAKRKNEVPVGAIIVKDGKVISKAHNLREKKNSVACHAEMIAIKKANKKLKSWRLEGCELYVTLEPCPMCAGAVLQARIEKVYIGTKDPKGGALKSNIMEHNLFNHNVDISFEYLNDESAILLKEFFKDIRKNK